MKFKIYKNYLVHLKILENVENLSPTNKSTDVSNSRVTNIYTSSGVLCIAKYLYKLTIAEL